MSTKPIDTFILNSVDLFKINPSQSAISITYQPPKVTAQPIDSSKNSINNLPKITFKTNNPHLSSTYKYKTNKNKDVSRLLNSIGPNGVSIIPNGILKRKTKNNNNKNSNKKVALITGLSTLIINNKIPEFKSTNITNNNNKDITKKKKKNNNSNNKNKNKR